MAQSPEESEHVRELRSEFQAMREDAVIDLIRETIAQLNKLGDRLEEYAKERTVPTVEPSKQGEY